MSVNTLPVHSDLTNVNFVALRVGDFLIVFLLLLISLESFGLRASFDGVSFTVKACWILITLVLRDLIFFGVDVLSSSFDYVLLKGDN